MSQTLQTAPSLLNDTIDDWRRSAFVWGQSDCLLSVGDYIAAAGHMDVASRFRGTYDTEEGAMAHVLEYEGHEGLIDLTGLPRVDQPERGDVAVIDTGETDVAALCTGDGFVLRLERGTVEVNARFVTVVAAWRV